MKKKKVVGRVVDVRPVGSLVLVEMLAPNEAAGSKLQYSQDSKSAPQGYVLAVGPSLKPADWGFEVGDRVILQGNFVPLPKLEENGRDLGMVEAHTIKGVLSESHILEN